MKKIFLLIILTYTTYASHSQASTRLKIGDTLPDLEFDGVWNYKTKKLQTSDFRGKLLILDFWDKTCKACIKAMPKMQELQKQFGNKIQILMVAPNSDEEVKELSKRIKYVNENKLPFLNGDSTLHKLFYFRTVPTHVWVNEAGKIIHITEGWDTNESTIAAYFRNQNPGIVEKQENEKFTKRYVRDSIEKIFNDSNIIQFSFFLHKIQGAGPCRFTKKDTSGKITEVTFINSFPLSMLQYAFSEMPLNFSDLRTVELKGESATSLLKSKTNGERTQWRDNQMTCYRLRLPTRLAGNALKFMQQDFTRYFNVNVSIKKQKIKCLVLECNGNSSKIKSKGGRDTICLLMGDKFIMKNSPIYGLVNSLNFHSDSKLKIPLFFDGTNITHNVDLEFDGDVLRNFDIEGIKTKLAPYGLTLVEGERIINKLVISDR